VWRPPQPPRQPRRPNAAGWPPGARPPPRGLLFSRGLLFPRLPRACPNLPGCSTCADLTRPFQNLRSGYKSGPLSLRSSVHSVYSVLPAQLSSSDQTDLLRHSDVTVLETDSLEIIKSIQTTTWDSSFRTITFPKLRFRLRGRTAWSWLRVLCSVTDCFTVLISIITTMLCEC